MLIFIHAHTDTHRSVTTERSAEILKSFSPLSQHNNFRLSSTPLAEGEELVDDPVCFAHKLLSAELQLFVSLENGRLHLPEVLNGGCVESVECGKSSYKVLELI